ncbi:MAG: heme exporter protein CcmD [Defluviicoccus sp.]
MNAEPALFDFGVYAVFVWSAFAVAAVVLISLVVISMRGLRTRAALLARLQDQLDAEANR